MKEIIGDLFQQKADAICITTNGFVKKDGTAVMGRGCALQAKELFPGIEKNLGLLIKELGNHVWIIFAIKKQHIISFPVKHNWWEKADLSLIERSAVQLVNMANIYKYKKVILPRPGCGNGQLDWQEVEPILKRILDDRFYIISRP